MQKNKILWLVFMLFASLSAQEIIVDKTLKNIHIKPKPLVRNDAKEVVYDSNTHLMWQDNHAAKETVRDWEGARSYCHNLTFAGFDDWRLPGIEELWSITDDTVYNPVIKRVFKNVTRDWVCSYWSSSDFARASSEAWNMTFFIGRDEWNDKSHTYYVRCVRDSK